MSSRYLCASRGLQLIFLQSRSLCSMHKTCIRWLPAATIRNTSQVWCRQLQGTKHKLLDSQTPLCQTLLAASSESRDTSKQNDQKKDGPIYMGSLTKMVRLVKAFSLSTSIMGLALQPFIYQHVSELPVVFGMAVGGSIGFFVFVTPLLLHLITRRYVSNIYYEPNTKLFTAETFTFFLTVKQHEFTAGDVKVFTTPRLFSTLSVAGKPLFIDASSFTDRDAGIHLLGYDKPMDWEINVEDLNDEDEPPKKA